MSNLLEILKAGSKNIKLVDYPGSTTKVALKILSQQDQQAATFATERHFKSEKIEVNLVTADEYEQEKATQILYRAIRDPQNLDEPIASTVTEFRKMLDRNEKKILIDDYLAFEAECNPSPENLSSEEFDKIFTDVKKNCVATVSNISSIHTLRKLLIIMASRPAILPTVNG